MRGGRPRITGCSAASIRVVTGVGAALRRRAPTNRPYAPESANAAAFEACRATGAVLLDDTVAFRRIETVRVVGGSLGLRRTYVFDYTRDGSTRQQGFVILTGRGIDSVGL